MKKKSEIKINQLSKAELNERQMNALQGGSACVCVGCGCPGSVDAMDAADRGYGDCMGDAIMSCGCLN